MTQRHYYNDAYTATFTAQIVEWLRVKDQRAVILDATYFYPTGGGQPNDLGAIADVPLLDVFTRDDDKAVVHVLSAEVTDAQVTCQVDWLRRFDHMQHHTGQHILTQAFVQTVEAHTVGFHLSPDTVTIDLDRAGLVVEDIERVEELANRIVFENHPVTARIIDPNDADGVRVRRLPDTLLTGGLRVIDIDGFDVTACGGTHVRMTGEIGMIKVVKVEKRGDKTRVEFKCGGRALRDYRLKTDVLGRIAGGMNAHISEADVVVAKLQEDYKVAARALKTAQGQLMEVEAAALLASAEVRGGVRLIRRVYDGRDMGDLKLLAARLVEQLGVVALLASSGEKCALVFVRSADAPGDMSALLKSVLAPLNGRGGGQPNMAQGGGVPADTAALTQALADAAALW
jgi:alanyl-tRNA synthetase